MGRNDNLRQILMQDEFLKELVQSQANVYCFLSNGIKLEGQITTYDQFSLMLTSSRGPASYQLVMKNAISTIVPQREGAAPHKTF